MKVTEEDLKVFLDGLFTLNTHRFGKVAEIMIKKIYNYQWSGKKSYDLYDSENNNRIEVKFSRVVKKHKQKIKETNVVDQCMSNAYLENRLITRDNIDIFKFDSNIQQIKRHKFDYLFYGLFFLDGIEIYGIESTKIDTIPGYSNKQHDGNIGEGQFHLNNNSIDFHRKNYIQMELNYDKLFELLQK